MICTNHILLKAIMQVIFLIYELSLKSGPANARLAGPLVLALHAVCHPISVQIQYCSPYVSCE